MSSVIEEMAQRYMQLYLKPQDGMSNSEIYKNIVLKGKKPGTSELRAFSHSERDRIFHKNTPAGEVEILYLYLREDFEQFIRIMMYRCEPATIPKSMGAAIISGIVNWRKIERHQMQYLLGGGMDWDAEFKRFTAEKANYSDTLIVVSQGAYSNLHYEETPYNEQKWMDVSLEIRIYHECAHFICGKLYSELKNVLWNEIIADCFGLLNATGSYNSCLAKAFLGVSEVGYIEGGRLKNYRSDMSSLNLAAKNISHLIDKISELTAECLAESKTPFEILNILEKNSQFFSRLL